MGMVRRFSGWAERGERGWLTLCIGFAFVLHFASMATALTLALEPTPRPTPQPAVERCVEVALIDEVVEPEVEDLEEIEEYGHAFVEPPPVYEFAEVEPPALEGDLDEDGVDPLDLKPIQPAVLVPDRPAPRVRKRPRKRGLRIRNAITARSTNLLAVIGTTGVETDSFASALEGGVVGGVSGGVSVGILKDEKRAAYIRKLRTALQKAFRPPTDGQGTVRMVVRVKRDGTLAGAVVRAGGNDALVEAAKRTIRNARIPKAPEGVLPLSFEMVFTVR